MPLQRQTNYRGRPPGLVNFVPTVAYHYFLALLAAFTQPGALLLAEPCTCSFLFLNVATQNISHDPDDGTRPNQSHQDDFDPSSNARMPPSSAVLDPVVASVGHMNRSRERERPFDRRSSDGAAAQGRRGPRSTSSRSPRGLLRVRSILFRGLAVSC